MLSIENLEKFTKHAQTSIENVVREYCEHLFLSYLYKQSGSEKLLFKGGTALRIVFHSPRYSEDLDFTGVNISPKEVEEIFTNTLANIENTGINVQLDEGKATSGGYLGIAIFKAYDFAIPVQIEVSLRNGKELKGITTLIENDYITAYTLVHLSKEEIVKGKMQALLNRHKPRDFYDYFFLLSGNYPLVKDKENLNLVRGLLEKSKIDFKSELRKFLPASHSMHLRDFKKVLEGKIKDYLG
ncbi:nucleotidyl transferase AbiEii/AbiGii toxin family protein [Pedobacter sp.]|jgi:predicted nucleotidyltransferase component of viral defense system|uniref:nucleotidyl transferase AbiEii/AbiGii toxin family protein n=1 Tax=Pedobacter sp. TaxID=1411316 RepID=UPI002CEB17BE|nr:nucleotidyl transferase AbiEii/AbiGii toxin family protein [Pedobacter sp.]HWW41999.1 nucleotidyl transferase AbiEii/AbiGii toxin family protein [Pedobacter sp.]